MVMPKWFHRLSVLSVVMLVAATTGASAQVLPVLNTFSGRTFEGTVDVSWPVLFDGCTFHTDGVVLNHSYGAVFRNCTFESKGGMVYVAETGDGIILADCEFKGCDGLMMSKEYTPADRNYITDVTVNGEECTVLDDQTAIIDIDGLELSESVRGSSNGPMLMIMSADRSSINGGETAHVKVRGLEKGMFIGWLSSDQDVEIKVGDDEMSCTVYAPESVREDKSVIISAYTEYGLEAACIIRLVPDVILKKKR